MLHQEIDEVFCFFATRIHVFERVIALAVAALVGFFAGIELRVYEKSVLKIVDSQSDSFWICDRAQVARHLQSAFVSFFDGGTEFRTRNVHIRFERSNAAIGPVVHGLAGVVWPCEFVQLNAETSRSFKIRPSHVEVRPGQLAGVDQPF